MSRRRHAGGVPHPAGRRRRPLAPLVLDGQRGLLLHVRRAGEQWLRWPCPRADGPRAAGPHRELGRAVPAGPRLRWPPLDTCDVLYLSLKTFSPAQVRSIQLDDWWYDGAEPDSHAHMCVRNLAPRPDLFPAGLPPLPPQISYHLYGPFFCPDNVYRGAIPFVNSRLASRGRCSHYHAPLSVFYTESSRKHTGRCMDDITARGDSPASRPSTTRTRCPTPPRYVGFGHIGALYCSSSTSHHIH
jgi:hypothetical protein